MRYRIKNAGKGGGLTVTVERDGKVIATANAKTMDDAIKQRTALHKKHGSA